MEGEWRQYNDAFVGVVEELCGRTSGKEVAKTVEETREAWKMIEGFRDRAEQPTTNRILRHLYGQKKKAVRRAVDRARTVPTA